MSCAAHPFMDYDSVIACHDAVRLPPVRDIALSIANGQTELLGYLDRALFAGVASAAHGSTLISERDAGLIATSFAR